VAALVVTLPAGKGKKGKKRGKACAPLFESTTA